MESAVRDAFSAFDTDRSGDIDASELRAALRQLGMQADGQQAAAVLQRYDSHGGGKLGQRVLSPLHRAEAIPGRRCGRRRCQPW